MSRKYGQQPRGPAPLPATEQAWGQRSICQVRLGHAPAGTVQTQSVSTDKRHLVSPSVPGEAASLLLNQMPLRRRKRRQSKTMKHLLQRLSVNLKSAVMNRASPSYLLASPQFLFPSGIAQWLVQLFVVKES